ncbi:hypothetical protein PRZ48_002563 [Zasmidium cellare]|uniref:Uncharacterized protein n=1 Tax=Zasmidium cellare TaxID=395010 RepID=A0ABR0F4E6_ZASCE|nr:hypothetical protein PRZ48_002563 [Zasmidium cellare]
MIGCDNESSKSTKREALRPIGDDQSFCDAIGGCDGNLETPQKRTEPGFVTIDVDKLPHLLPGGIIGIGPQVEEEKREAQLVEACVMPYGCNGDPNDGPGDFPDIRNFFNDEKREPEPEPEAEEEKREAQLVEACVMPYGCNGDPNDGPGSDDFPIDFPEIGLHGAEEKRSPSDTLSVNPDDLVHLDPDEICGFKGCGGVAGPVEIGSLPEVIEEKREAEAQYELCVMPFGCNDNEHDLPGDRGDFGLDV